MSDRLAAAEEAISSLKQEIINLKSEPPKIKSCPPEDLSHTNNNGCDSKSKCSSVFIPIDPSSNFSEETESNSEVNVDLCSKSPVLKTKARSSEIKLDLKLDHNHSSDRVSPLRSRNLSKSPPFTIDNDFTSDKSYISFTDLLSDQPVNGKSSPRLEVTNDSSPSENNASIFSTSTTCPLDVQESVEVTKPNVNKIKLSKKRSLKHLSKHSKSSKVNSVNSEVSLIIKKEPIPQPFIESVEISNLKLEQTSSISGGSDELAKNESLQKQDLHCAISVNSETEEGRPNNFEKETENEELTASNDQGHLNKTEQTYLTASNDQADLNKTEETYSAHDSLIAVESPKLQISELKKNNSNLRGELIEINFYEIVIINYYPYCKCSTTPSKDVFRSCAWNLAVGQFVIRNNVSFS